MILEEINPYIRHSGQSVIPAPYHINRRIILDYELLYVDDGEFLLTYNDKDFFCPKGSILFICPNIPHSFHILTKDLSQPHIHFDLQYDSYSEKVFISYQDYDELSPSHRLMIRENVFPELAHSPFLKINDKETFFKTFYQIINEKDLRSLNCKAKMLCLLQTIITDNAFDITYKQSFSTKIAFLLKSYIDSNYEQDISLDTLESQFNYNKFYIEKSFKQEHGISVISYRNNKRFEVALKFLEDHSVSQTAQMLGFSSIYSFSRAFRLAYGKSPTKYKKE